MELMLSSGPETGVVGEETGRRSNSSRHGSIVWRLKSEEPEKTEQGEAHVLKF